MSTIRGKRAFSESNSPSEQQTKKRKTTDTDTSILELTNSHRGVRGIFGDDIVYFIQKDYNIESNFVPPKYLKLSRDNAHKLLKQSPIDIDGESLKCKLFEGKLPRTYSHTHTHNTRAHYHKRRYNSRSRSRSREHLQRNDRDRYSHRDRHRHKKSADLFSKYRKYNRYNAPAKGVVGYTVWIGNITKKASKPYLISVLEDFGEILNVYVLSQHCNQYNCAFVDFTSPLGILSIGKAVFYHRLKIYNVPINVVLRQKTIQLLLQNGYKKQLSQMVRYGMLNLKHQKYYHSLKHRYDRHHRRESSESSESESECEDGEIKEECEPGEINILAKNNSIKQRIAEYKRKKANLVSDLSVLSDYDLISKRICFLRDLNATQTENMERYERESVRMSEECKGVCQDLKKHKSKLSGMKGEIRAKESEYKTVLNEWIGIRKEWAKKEKDLKNENRDLLNGFSLISGKVQSENETFERLDTEQKAKNARYSVLHYKIASKKKEIESGYDKYDKCYNKMEKQYNGLKNRFESEGRQHKNTQKILAETVYKVKESMKSIKKRAKDKDLVIERLQNRLKLYKHHLNRYATIKQTK